MRHTESAGRRDRTTNPSDETVIVVGGGVGGLACTLDLAARGVDVLLLERAREPGGKLRQVWLGGRGLDAGPTVFTMRWVFDALCADAGLRLDDHLRLQTAHTLGRHVWREGEVLDLSADVETSAAAIAAFAGPREADGYRHFCERAALIYRTLEAPYLRSARPTPLSLAWRCGLRGLPDLLRIAPFTRLWDALGRHFRDPRLRQLFGRYATYCGSSPLRAPATLMLVAHVERAGLWTVEGGLVELARALAAMACRRGARIRCGAEVRRIVVRDGRAAGVELDGGETLAASAVVFAGDADALARGLLGPEATAAPRRSDSLSALTWHVLGAPSGTALLHHNVFFSGDSPAEFSALFDDRRVPDDPTVYLCAQDRGSEPGGGAAATPERLMALINAPADAPVPEAARCRDLILQRLARGGLTPNPSDEGELTTPADFARLFPGSRGAIYGAASHGWASAFRRPAARTRLPGLYRAGGTTHPGPGVPMAALSGRQAATALLEDRARSRRRSTSTWSTAAMPGGTSTR